MNKIVSQKVNELVCDIIATTEIQQAIKTGQTTTEECTKEYTEQITTGNADSLGYYLEDCGCACLAERVSELARMF